MNSYDTFLIIGLFARMRGKHLSAATVEAILDELSTSEPDDTAAQASYPAALTARLQEMEKELRAQYLQSLAADLEAQAERFKQELPALAAAHRRSGEKERAEAAYKAAAHVPDPSEFIAKQKEFEKLAMEELTKRHLATDTAPGASRK